jgi:tetratricopeptide (TPR) repeat protein
VRADHWDEGLAGCRAAIVTASQIDDFAVQSGASDCLVEALTMLGRYTELAPVIERKIDEATRSCGDDCPKLADFLTVRASITRRQGKLAEARASAERGLAIRVKDFGESSPRVADSLIALADIADAAGDPAEARRQRERALTLTDEVQPVQALTAMRIHMQLATAAANASRRAEAMPHFERAVALARQHAGKDSPVLGILLMNFGQVKADDDLDAGLEMIQTARDILERAHDKRAAHAAAALLVVANRHKRFVDAARFGEQALTSCNADTSPATRAIIEWNLARALVATRGDRARARVLAGSARRRYLQLGAGEASNVAEIDRWLASH